MKKKRERATSHKEKRKETKNPIEYRIASQRIN